MVFFLTHHLGKVLFFYSSGGSGVFSLSSGGQSSFFYSLAGLQVFGFTRQLDNFYFIYTSGGLVCVLLVRMVKVLFYSSDQGWFFTRQVGQVFFLLVRWVPWGRGGSRTSVHTGSQHCHNYPKRGLCLCPKQPLNNFKQFDPKHDPN